MERKAIYIIATGILASIVSVVWGNNYGLSAIQFISGLLGVAAVCFGIAFTRFDAPIKDRIKFSRIILSIGLSIFLLGIAFKFLSIPSASIIFSIGCFFLTFAYLPLLTKNRIEKWKQYTRSSWHAFILSFGDLFSFSALLLGILFKIMHWPYATNMLWVGIGVLSVTLVSWNRLFSKEIVLRKEAEEKVKISLDKLQIQHLLIEEKNKEITDSINYAKRIQDAKLPKKEEIYSALAQSFVLFTPKDIVSGDFYFFYKKEGSVFIAAADCTGHGVPGALMSMIGSERLHDAVSQTSDTSEILKNLNKGIKTSLRQSEEDDSTRDGMDIALCSVDIEKRIVKYAGANRPIWLIRKGATEIEVIKATKKAIGGFTEDDQLFETHELKLQQGDTFYIFSDGYADLFSGQNGKKLTTKKLKQILLDIQNKNMQEQEKYLDNFAENWKGGTEQVDDILVIGVRL